MNTAITIKVVRGMALVTALIMLYYFIAQSERVFSSENPFMVPDVALALLLAISAFLPQRLAVPSMLFSFAFATGVIGVSFFNHLTNDRFDVAHVFLIIGFLVASTLLCGVITKSTTSKKT